MRGRKRGATGVTSDAFDRVSTYVDRLANDELLRRRLAAAIASGVAAQERARRQIVRGAARRVTADAVLRAQVAEAASQLRKVRGRVRKRRSHRTRNIVLFVTGCGIVAAALPQVRHAVVAKMRDGSRARSGWWPADDHAGVGTVIEEIEVAVPVSTAYNQWTQFEEFPKFMEGVDEVKQLDDTLLHWAVTVAGKKAEWDAKIVEQKPDRLIAWESVEGRQNRGIVSFEPAGSGSRTRIRLQMSYAPTGAAESVGSAIGLDERRVSADLERFRELIESRQRESGAWRGEIKDGETAGGQESMP